jgi:DNA-directed RNA polymerase subunit RPC12/RpoP
MREEWCTKCGGTGNVGDIRLPKAVLKQACPRCSGSGHRYIVSPPLPKAPEPSAIGYFAGTIVLLLLSLIPEWAFGYLAFHTDKIDPCILSLAISFSIAPSFIVFCLLRECWRRVRPPKVETSPAPVTTSCTNCGQELELPDLRDGKTLVVECNKCGREFQHRSGKSD